MGGWAWKRMGLGGWGWKAGSERGEGSNGCLPPTELTLDTVLAAMRAGTPPRGAWPWPVFRLWSVCVAVIYI